MNQSIHFLKSTLCFLWRINQQWFGSGSNDLSPKFSIHRLSEKQTIRLKYNNLTFLGKWAEPQYLARRCTPEQSEPALLPQTDSASCRKALGEEPILQPATRGRSWLPQDYFNMKNLLTNCTASASDVETQAAREESRTSSLTTVNSKYRSTAHKNHTECTALYRGKLPPFLHLVVTWIITFSIKLILSKAMVILARTSTFLTYRTLQPKKGEYIFLSRKCLWNFYQDIWILNHKTSFIRFLKFQVNISH